MSAQGYGSITLTDVLDGAQIWTTTTAPTTPNYTFTKSNLNGDSNADIKVGDLIFYSYYRYTVASVGTTTVQAGNQQNLRGATGAAGLNNATVILYQRAASQPAKPSADITYTFSSGVATGGLGSWTQSVPTGSESVWMTLATASSNTTTDTIGASEWSTPIQLVKDGYNQATIFLYQRAASKPSKPSSSITYTFSTAGVNTVPSGWSRTIPENNGHPCYVTTAVAYGQGSTATVAASAWSDVVELVEDGFSPTVSISDSNGVTTITVTDVNGTDTGTINRGSVWYSGTTITGTSTTATVFSNSGVAYALVNDHYLNTSTQNVYICTVAGNAATAKWKYEQNIKGATGTKGDNGYVHIKYSDDGGTTFTGNDGENPGTWIGMYTDNSPIDSTSVGAYTWSRVQGIGISSWKTQYYLSTSNTSQAGGSWSDSVPQFVAGRYYWTREITTWTDGSTTNGTPILNMGLTNANGNAYDAAVMAGEMEPELIVGTHGTTATASWTGISTKLSSIQSGTRIQYKMTSAGASNVTLDLTLKDQSTTGAKPVYYSNTTRLNTQYGVGAVIDMIYDGEAWRILNPYTNSNTVGSYGASSLTAGTNGIKQYSLIMQDANGTWQSFTTTHGTGTTKSRNSVEFDLGSKIYYMSGSSNYASGSGCTTCFSSYSIDLRYSTNCGKTLVPGQPVYLVGELVEGRFYLAETWWTQTEPTTVDNKIYIYLGIAYGTYTIYLVEEHPIYIYYNGKFQLRSDAITSENYLKNNPGIGMKINYSAFNTADSGEMYIHGFTDGVPSDTDGYIYWNEIKRTVPKKMINPNDVLPFGRYIYIVYRLASADATTGTIYMVWHNSGWKYAVTPTPSAVGGTWTWSDATDIVLGQFIEPGSEQDVVEAYLYWPPRSPSEVKTTTASPYQYSQSAVAWYEANGSTTVNATTMLAAWADGAFSTTTKIDGGFIKAHTIQAEHLATDAIMSNNFIASDNPASPFSATGTFLDLTTGNLYSPNFGIDNTYGTAYLNGEIVATSGRIGNSAASNYWDIGTKTDYNAQQSAAITGVGTAYLQIGKFRLSNNLLDTSSYNAQNKITYPLYDGTYWDFGIQAPELNTATTGFVSGVDDNFIYIRNHVNTIPTLKTDWNYVFRVDKNGMIWINGVSLDQKYASIDGVSGAYLPLTGGTVSGDLTVSGALTATASQANKLTHSITINGTAWDGSSNLTVPTLGVAYGGTGATTFTSGAALIGNGSGAIQTREIRNNTSVGALGWTASGTDITLTTTNTLAYWDGRYRTTNNDSNLEYVKLGKLGTVVTHNIDEFITTSGGIIDGSLQTTDMTAGNLIVTGAGRFTNGLFGDLTGNADTADKVNHDLIIKLNSGTTEGTNMFTFNGSVAKTLDVTKSAIGLGNVENTKLSTWAGSSNLTTTKVGTLAAAAAKGVDTSIDDSSTSGNLPTSAAVASFVEGKGYVTSSGVTSVRVQATSPVVSSTNTAQSSTLNTTISLADAYGDTKNPYGTKTKNYVLAGPSSGNAAAPTFRALVSDDIPTLAASKVGLGNVTNNKQVKGLASGTSNGNLVSWGSDGYTVADSGITVSGVNKTVTTLASNDAGKLVLTYLDGTTSEPIEVKIIGQSGSSVSYADALNVNGTAVGSSSVPVFINAQGQPQTANTIPSVTLNGSTNNSPSFYAPTSAGSSNQYLKSNGSGAPSWATFSKSTVGLDNVDNTSDANKPISTATQTALDSKASKQNGIYIVKGTQTASTASWTGDLDLSALYDGLTIAYYLPYASASSTNVTLNLTLSDETTTGAIDVYVNGDTRLTTHYPVGSVVYLTYWSAGSISITGEATTTARWVGSEYWVANTNTVGEYAGTLIAGTNGMPRYSLVMQVDETHWEGLVLTSSKGTSKTKNSSGFLITSPILYQNAATYTSGNSAGQSGCWSTASIDTRYSTNGGQFSAAGNPFYLIVSLNNGKFYLKDTTWWTDRLPTTNDGYYYIYIGQFYSKYQCTLQPTHPIFYYNNGIKLYSPYTTVNGHIVESNVPANAVFTDTTDLTQMTGTLGVGHGGTGKDSWTQYGLVYASAANQLSQLDVGLSGQVLISGGSSSPTWTNQSALSVGSATKDGSGNTITSYYCTLSTDQTLSGAKTFSAVASFTNTTVSTSKSTGAVKISGGLGVSGAVHSQTVSIDDAVELQYNTTTKSLDFVFN